MLIAERLKGRARVLIAALLLLSLAPKSARAVVDVASPALAGGGELYLHHCARCHGRSGNGDGPEMARLGRRLHRLADCDWMSLMSDATLFLLIKEGGPAVGFPAGMPAFGNQLSSDQITRLIGYVREFCKAKNLEANSALVPLPRLALGRASFATARSIVQGAPLSQSRSGAWPVRRVDAQLDRESFEKPGVKSK
jgi:mono/diheme cytochrome c family protein